MHLGQEPAQLPLEAVRVLDFADGVGAYCGKLLADIGADVIKVERPEGDDLRFRPPYRDGVSTPGEASLLFGYYANNKRGITLDWTRPGSYNLLRELAATADVAIVSPDHRHPMVGFDPDIPTFSWLGSRTLLCSITPFGLSGPWRNWRATAFTSFACSGLMHGVGPIDGPPLAMPGQQLYDEASVRAATLIEVVLSAETSLRGQTIDVAAHDVAAWQLLMTERYSMIGRITTRGTNFGPPPGGIWRCRDGFVDIAAHAPSHWDLFVELLGNPEDLVEPLYKERVMRAQLHDMLSPIIAEHIRQWGAQEFVERGQALGLPCALMYRPEEFLSDVQPLARGSFVEVDHPELGVMTLPGPSVHSRGPLLTYRRPAPTLGEANRDVYIHELGYSAADLNDWRRDGLI
jgi:crotonobetainyl-CoA:carnitine CoA-transferase CaiB-like acyl-CoA transferase